MTLSRRKPCAWPQKAAARRRPPISSKLFSRWQEAKLVAEVGSVEIARDPEVRQLRAQLKRAEQELGILKKPWSSSAGRPGEYLSLHRPAPSTSARTPTLPDAPRVGKYVSMRGSAASCPLPSQLGKWLSERRLGGMRPATAPAVYELSYARRLPNRPLAYPAGVGRRRLARPATTLLCAPHHRLRP